MRAPGARAAWAISGTVVPYWWSVAPFHAVVFGGMARNITEQARDAS